MASSEIIQIRKNNLQPPTPLLQTSPVPMYDGTHTSKQLPLSLMLLITSYLDDVADIARVTRAAKILYYLNLPKLYENVTLRSYREIRYFEGRPEGLGAGSPFAMALDGLVSRNVAGYVRNFNLLGEWKECGVGEFEKGRVPDNSMMLNIVMRAAIDKMDRLESFRWELTSNPLKTVYQGLSARSSLTSLTIKFQSTRIPRPTVLMPAIPNLKSLHLLNIDPLCYPDDPSLLLLQAKKLESLKLEWSSRMRNEKEPSVHLGSYFGRSITAKHKLPLKHFAMKNLYCRKDADMDDVIDHTTLRSVATINCVNPQDPSTVFSDATWMTSNSNLSLWTKLKHVRLDRLDSRDAAPMSMLTGLEEIYLVRRDAESASSSPAVTNSVSSDSSSPETPTSTEMQKAMISVGSDYLAAIIASHGPSLKKLLLSDRWALGFEVIKNLLINCPNLEQLGLAVEKNDPEIMHRIMPYGPKLRALRILLRPDDALTRKLNEVDDETHCIGIGTSTWAEAFKNLRWLGIGNKYFELKGEVIKVPDPMTKQSRPLRIVKMVDWERIREIEIWGLDTLDL